MINNNYLSSSRVIDFNNQQVLDVTPDHNRPLALVDLAVLNKLTDLLPKSDFSSIRHNFREQIMNTSNLEQLVQASEDFIAFHRSVNLIREVLSMDVNQIQEDEQVRVVGRIDIDDDPYGDRPSKSKY
jgi:hypothetical protein